MEYKDITMTMDRQSWLFLIDVIDKSVQDIFTRCHHITVKLPNIIKSYSDHIGDHIACTQLFLCYAEAIGNLFERDYGRDMLL